MEYYGLRATGNLRIMFAILRKHKIKRGKVMRSVLSVFAILAAVFLLNGCATMSNPDTSNAMYGKMFTEIFPTFDVTKLENYTYFPPEKFTVEGLSGIERCERDGAYYRIILSPQTDYRKTRRTFLINSSGTILNTADLETYYF